MELMTTELKKQFAEVGLQDIPDPIVIAKYFNPAGAQTWLAIAYYPEERMFFGYVSLFNDPDDNELGYFALQELEEYKGLYGLGIERDLYFEQDRLSVVKERERIY